MKYLMSLFTLVAVAGVTGVWADELPPGGGRRGPNIRIRPMQDEGPVNEDLKKIQESDEFKALLEQERQAREEMQTLMKKVTESPEYKAAQTKAMEARTKKMALLKPIYDKMGGGGGMKPHPGGRMMPPPPMPEPGR